MNRYAVSSSFALVVAAISVASMGCALDAGQEVDEDTDSAGEAATVIASDECRPPKFPKLHAQAQLRSNGWIWGVMQNVGSTTINNHNDIEIWAKSEESGTTKKVLKTTDDLQLDATYKLFKTSPGSLYTVEFHFDRPNASDPKCQAYLQR